jgi:hypothetical protein
METDGDSQDVDSHAPVTMNGISFQRMPDDWWFYFINGTWCFRLHREDIDPQVDVLDSVTIEDHLYSVWK